MLSTKFQILVVNKFQKCIKNMTLMLIVTKTISERSLWLQGGCFKTPQKGARLKFTHVNMRGGAELLIYNTIFWKNENGPKCSFLEIICWFLARRVIGPFTTPNCYQNRELRQIFYQIFFLQLLCFNVNYH